MRLNFITVSRNPERVRSLESSLEAALGSAPAIHASLEVIDGQRFDLFRGYNAGAGRARGEILVFLHDDVRLLGNSLTFQEPLALLEQPETGLLGVAGATYLGRCGCWWEAPVRTRRGAVAQARDGDFGLEWAVWPKRAGRFGPVVVLDGLFLMCRRAVFERLGGFDQATYTDYHFYDLDITFRATLAGLVNYAAPLPLLHGSRGNAGDAWERNRRIFVRKFAAHLPYWLAPPPRPSEAWRASWAARRRLARAALSRRLRQIRDPESRRAF